MNDKDFDEKLKAVIKKDIKLSNEYEISVQNAIENAESQKNYKNNHKFLRFAQRFVAVVVISALGATAYAASTGKLNLGLDLRNIGHSKVSKNYEDNASLVDKKIETDYYTINLESVSGDSAYLILEYKIKFKENVLDEVNEIEYDSVEGYCLNISGDIAINDDKIYGRKYVNKISENEYLYIQMIDLMEVDTTEINLKIWLDQISINNENKEWGRIDKEIKANVTLENTDLTANLQEQVLDENQKVVINRISNSPYETYITGTIITENMTMEEYYKKYTGSYEEGTKYESFIVQDENGQKLQAIVYDGNTAGINYYVLENGEYTKVDYIDEVDYEKDIVKVEENFRILLDEKLENTKIKLYVTYNELPNDRNDEEAKEYEAATWNKLETGDVNYTAKSSLGGTLTFYKIELDDEYLSFYYKIDGIIGDESEILLRKNNGKMNYIFPTENEIAGINGDENRFKFAVETFYRAGLDVFDDNLAEIFDKLEFTMLFGCKSSFIVEPIECEISSENSSKANFEDWEFMDIYEKTISFTSKVTNDFYRAYGVGGKSESIYNYTITIKYNDNGDLLGVDGDYPYLEDYIENNNITKESELIDFLKQNEENSEFVEN